MGKTYCKKMWVDLQKLEKPCRTLTGFLLERTSLTTILDSTGSNFVPKYQVTCSQSQNHLSPKDLLQKLQHICAFISLTTVQSA